MIKEKDILRFFSNVELSDAESQYLDYHALRLSYTINVIQEFCDRFSAKKILDIGPHFLTLCIKEFIRPDVKISTMGFFNDRIVPWEIIDEHIHMDLNHADASLDKISGKLFDLIVFAETIEHLYTSPIIVLDFLKKAIKKPNGGLLVQTPNAVSLGKRIEMLSGKNPYEPIRIERNDPGHFREYTMQELIEYGAMVDLQVWRKEYCSYWPDSNKLYNKLENKFPAFRKGITIIFENLS